MKVGVEQRINTVRGSRFKWTICILLLLVTAMNYLDRQVLSLIATKLIAEFHLNKEEFGQLVAAFRYSYAFVQLFGGWAVDAYGAIRVFPAAVGVWSAAGVLTAFAPTLTAVALCRILLGVGEAFNWPCALKVTERIVEAADRTLANGIFNSGTALGAMLAPVVVTVCTMRWGWRSSFAFTGALGLLWLCLWPIFTRYSARELRGSPTSFSKVLNVFVLIAHKKSFWLLAGSAVIANGISYFLADWIPLYLETERGFSFRAGNMLSILVYGGLDVGSIAAGAFVRRAVRYGAAVPRARALALFMCCVLMTFAVEAGFTTYRPVSVGCIVLTAIGVAGFLSIYLSLVQEIEPLHVGATAGMLGGIGNLAYGIVSPMIGHLADLRETKLTFLLIGGLPWILYLILYRIATE